MLLHCYFDFIATRLQKEKMFFMEMLCLCLKKTWFLSSHSHLQVNTLGEWIVGIYLHEFTNNEQEISAECGIENFEFIVSERVQVNPDNSRATSVLTFLLSIELLLNTLHKETLHWNNYILGTDKPWCKDSGVLNLHHGYYTTIMKSRRLFHHNSVTWHKSTNQKIRIRTVYEIWIIRYLLVRLSIMSTAKC